MHNALERLSQNLHNNIRTFFFFLTELEVLYIQSTFQRNDY